MPKRSAVLTAATFAYFAAVMQRSSLGVASLEAASRFHVSASALAALAVFQLAVYAAMQIPVGILLDRFGAKAMLQIGAIGMFAGQLLVAYATDINAAYVGRALVGLGDAFTFISLLRLVVAWSTPKVAGRTQQNLAALGQLGQVASAIPFAIALANFGWQNAFEISSSVVLLGAILVSLLVKNQPSGVAATHQDMTLRQSFNLLVENIRFSGTRMSFWIHFTLQSSGSVFALLWGVPFLVAGEGQTRQFASALLTMQMLLSLVWGVALGWIAEYRPQWRGRVVLGIASSIIAIWVVFALLPTQAPGWLLVLLVIIISMGGSGSMLAMDFSRGFIPKERLGSANGFINVGGFLATFTMMWLAGVILDAVQQSTGSASAFTFAGFRLALAVQILVVGFGLVMYLIERARTSKTHEV